MIFCCKYLYFRQKYIIFAAVIDISFLPNGVYVIRAITIDGQILQTKIIHE